MDAAWTTGARSSRAVRTARLRSEQAERGTPTTIASGQRRSALPVGIAERTPYSRQGYEAEVTTPRPEEDPPTISRSARPAPSGSSRRATCTKNWSQSTSRIRRGRASGVIVVKVANRIDGGRVGVTSGGHVPSAPCPSEVPEPQAPRGVSIQANETTAFEEIYQNGLPLRAARARIRVRRSRAAHRRPDDGDPSFQAPRRLHAEAELRPRVPLGPARLLRRAASPRTRRSARRGPDRSPEQRRRLPQPRPLLGRADARWFRHADRRPRHRDRRGL